MLTTRDAPLAGPAPRVLLVAPPALRSRAAAWIERAGGVAVGSENPALGGCDAVLAELDADEGAATDALLAALRAEAARTPCVVVFPPTLIDVVEAALGDTPVERLCAPDPVARTAALGLALARRHLAPSHVGEERDAARLRALSEEAARIAATLAVLADEEAARPALAPALPPDAPAGPALDAPAIRAIIRARRLRAHYFAADLFADPAWDILLDLMAARLEGAAVAVSSLCIAAAVPPTTGLRWIRALTDAGLLVRQPDPRDARRVFIAMADPAAEAMAAYLTAAARIAPVT